ncbi:MAG: glycine cleavage system aminomethyltransferase GcvT [Gammaproteobacteria bacterium]
MSPPSNNQAGTETSRRTALYDLHLAHGAKMVPFAGYAMPLQYAGGIRHEHQHTRTAAGLFDVSHMGQIRIAGTDAAAALETLVTGDITGLNNHQQRYTLLTNDRGGVLDDLMVVKRPDSLSLVVNAACKHNDLTLLAAALGGARVALADDRALLALQGPKAAEVLYGFNSAVTGLSFMQAGEFELDRIACFITRSGYTGEDGFEISVAADEAGSLAERLLEVPGVELIGLGARDSLRLEAGLCLYGHELDETTTPVEADLAWAIGAKYRRGEAEARFPGAGRVLEQLRAGPARKRVGLKPADRLPVREGTPLLDDGGERAGLVTSGGFGPTVGGPVALGYVDRAYTDAGTELQVVIRNRRHRLHVAGLPFIKHRYHKTG